MVYTIQNTGTSAATKETGYRIPIHSTKPGEAQGAAAGEVCIFCRDFAGTKRPLVSYASVTHRRASPVLKPLLVFKLSPEVFLVGRWNQGKEKALVFVGFYGGERIDFGDNSIEDVSWLCSPSESELDMVISLKMLVIQRARVIGHGELAEKFDLKMLRALGFILMEYLKGRVKDFSFKPGLAESAAFMDGCNLLKCKLDNIMSIAATKTFIVMDSKKRPSKMHVQDTQDRILT